MVQITQGPIQGHYSDNIFQGILLYDKSCISIQISVNYVHKSSINNLPAFVQVKVWYQLGNKPLSKPMVV